MPVPSLNLERVDRSPEYLERKKRIAKYGRVTKFSNKPSPQKHVSGRSDAEPSSPAIEDIFNKLTRYHVHVSKDLKVIERKQLFDDGGLIYLSRTVDPRKCNVFRFRILETSQADIWIGVERKDPKFVWFFRLWNGMKCDSSGVSLEYTGTKARSGDVIQMIIDRGRLSFILNTDNLGIAFEDSRLMEPEVSPFVFMHTNDDWVEVLRGSCS